MALIDTRKAVAIIKSYAIGEQGDYLDGIADAVHCVLNTPKVDAVPVVRCGECEYRMFDSLFGKDICTGYFRGNQVASDDYCSRGKRKENDPLKMQAEPPREEKRDSSLRSE